MSSTIDSVRDVLVRSLMRSRRSYEIVSIVGTILLWELLTATSLISTTVIPRPSTVFLTTATLLTTSNFLGHVWITVYRTIFASILAVIPGVIIGLLMGWNERFKAAFYPIMSGVYPLPKIALLPLLMLIFGVGERALVLTAVIAAVFLILLNAMHGVEEVGSIYFEAAEDNGVDSTYHYFREVLLPATLPRLFTGLRLTLTTALVVVISVEFIASNEGLGYFIWVSWSTYVLPNMYAGLVVAGALGMVITYGLDYLNTWLIPWQEATSS